MAYLGPKDMQRMVLIVIAVIIAVLYLTLRSVKIRSSRCLSWC